MIKKWFGRNKMRGVGRIGKVSVDGEWMIEEGGMGGRMGWTS